MRLRIRVQAILKAPNRAGILFGRALRVTPIALRFGETLVTAGLTMSINLLASAVAARALGPEGRGELAAILIWPQVLSLAFYFGLPVSAVYNIKKHPNFVNMTVGGIYVLGLIAGLLANIVGIMIIPLIMEDYGKSLIYASQHVLLVFAPSLIIYQISLSIVRAHDNFKIFNLVRILVPSLILLGLIALQILDMLTSVAAAWLYGFARIIAMAWPLYWIWQSCKPRLPGLHYMVTHLLHYSMRSTCIDIVYAIHEFLDRLVVISMLASSAVGLYAAAGNLALPIQEMGRAIVLVLFPKVAGVSEQRAIEITEMAVRLGFVAGLFAIIPLFLAAPIIINLCFGKEFIEATPIFRLLTVAFLLVSMSFILDQAFMATGRPGSVGVMLMIELLLLAILLFALVPSEGMHGAALARALTSAGGVLMRLVAFPLLLKRRVPRLLPRSADFAALIDRKPPPGG